MRIESPKDNGLVGYWNFNEGNNTGAILDVSGNGNNGVRHGGGGLVWTGATVSGMSRLQFDNPYVMKFDGTDDEVNVTGFPSMSANMSVSMWIRATNFSTSGTRNPRLIAKVDDGNNRWEMISGNASNPSTVEVSLTNGGTNVDKVTTGTIATGVWNHLVFTYDGTNLAIYVNGVSQTLGAGAAPSFQAGTDLYIGGRNDASGQFAGLIDDARIYNRALSANEVVNLYRGRYAAGGTSTPTFTLGNNLAASTLAIDSGILDTSSYTSTVTNALTLARGNGKLTLGSATATLNGGLTLSGSTVTGAGGTLAVTGNVTENTGSLIAPSGTLTVTGNWSKYGGTFTHNSGTVQLTGTNQTMTGSTTFNNLTKTVTSADTLTLAATTTQTIAGTLTLQGAAGNLLSLRSSQTGTQWKINPQGTRTLSYLDVKDSNNTNGTAITTSGLNITDSGNNTNWTFTIPTTTTLTSGTNPTTYGGSTTLTATVTSGATGTVTFKDGSTTIGTCTLSASTCSTGVSSLRAGSHSLTAIYAGDGTYLTSTSGTLTQTVNKADPTVTLASGTNPSTYGNSISLTATLSTATGTGTITFKDGSTTIGTATVGQGSGSLAISTLRAGSHSLTATYNGDTNFNSATSNAVTQTVNKASSTTTLASGTNPSTYGNSITLTASISPTSGTGTITFKDGSTTIGSATIGHGSGSLAISTLGAGSHSLTAVYGGDTNLNTSTSNTVTQTVNQASTTTSLASGTNPSTFGNVITLTGTVTPSTATGTLTFKDGSTTIGTATIGQGSGSLAIATLRAGSHSLTVVYGGNVHYTGSTSNTVTQTVNKATSTTTISSDTNPSTYGNSITLTGTVTPSTGTGTITFKDGSTTIGTCTLSGGSCTFATSTLRAGSHSLTAVYGGNTNYLTSTSGTLTQTVNKADPTATLASGTNPSTYSNSITLTATLSTATGTGTITFKDGSTTIGTATVGQGSGSLAISTLRAGSHSLTATYNGDTNFNSATSNAVTQTVSKASSTTTLVSGTNPSTYGNSITLTASISPTSGTGTITFKDGSTTIGSATIGHGSGSLAISTLGAGSHSLTAVYGGDTNFSTSTSDTATQTVNTADSTVTLTSSLNPSTYGSGVTLTALLNTTTAAGTITFKDGSTTLGTVTAGQGSGSLAIATLGAGSHSLTATYGGDTNYNSATSNAVTQTVNKATSFTDISSDNNPSTYGGSVTLTGVVAPSTATGTLTFKDGTTSFATCTLSSGSCTVGTSSLRAGNHSLTALYGGNSNYLTSTSSTLTQTVNKADSAVTLASSFNPSTYGSGVILTATLSTSTGTGAITFKDGTITIGTATVGHGSGSLTIATLRAGTHSLTATYGGDTNGNSATSLAVTQTVTLAQTVAFLSTFPNPSLEGQRVTLAGFVMPAAVTGTLTFREGTLELGTATLGRGSGSIAITTFIPGFHDLTVIYGGDVNHAGSTSETNRQSVERADSSNGGGAGGETGGGSRGSGGGNGDNNEPVAAAPIHVQITVKPPSPEKPVIATQPVETPPVAEQPAPETTAAASPPPSAPGAPAELRAKIATLRQERDQERQVAWNARAEQRRNDREQKLTALRGVMDALFSPAVVTPPTPTVGIAEKLSRGAQIALNGARRAVAFSVNAAADTYLSMQDRAAGAWDSVTSTVAELAQRTVENVQIAFIQGTTAVADGKDRLISFVHGAADASIRFAQRGSQSVRQIALQLGTIGGTHSGAPSAPVVNGGEKPAPMHAAPSASPAPTPTESPKQEAVANYPTKLTKKGSTMMLASLSLAIFDPSGNPFAKTPVVLFSTPKIAVTSDDGIATFHDVEVGKHQLDIHVEGEAVQHQDIIIEPPSGLTVDEKHQLDVLLPVIKVVAQPSLHAGPLQSVPWGLWIVLALLLLSNAVFAILFLLRKKLPFARTP